MRRRCSLAIALACFGIAAAEGANAYDEAVAKLASDLTRDFAWKAADAQPVAAVGWFVFGETKHTAQFGNLLSSDVRAALLREKKVKVATLDLKELDDAKFLWITDSINPATVPKAPEGFTAFTLLVRGRYYADVRKDSVELRARRAGTGTRPYRRMVGPRRDECRGRSPCLPPPPPSRVPRRRFPSTPPSWAESTT